MRFDLDDLPSEPALLQHLIRDMAAAVEHRDGEIERLKSIIKKLQRAQFGRRSERLDPDQLALALEEIDSDLAREERSVRLAKSKAGERPSRRKPLPGHLSREEVRLDIESMICSCCGGALHVIGESVSEMLDWVPAQLRVIRTTRPKYACRTCETVAQAPAAERPIAGGLATPALLAQVLVSKYCDHTPLYRQSQIFARHGVDLPRSTLAGWVGGACWWLEALHERLARNVFASDHLFADDTPVPVLDPGRGRTKTGRLWVYAREQRAWGGPEPPAAVYLYAPDRKAERPASHLEHFSGVLHVDGYAGFEPLADKGDVVLAACWSHTRRKFYEVAQATNAPIAVEALRRIGELYAVEADVHGQSPAQRLAARRSPLQANHRRFARLARGAASVAVGKQHTRRSDPVRAGALAWSDPLPARRPHRTGHEPRRARNSTGCSRKEESSLRGQRWRRSSMGCALFADRNLQA